MGRAAVILFYDEDDKRLFLRQRAALEGSSLRA